MMDLKRMKPGTTVTVTLRAQDLLVICSALESGRYDLVRPVMQSLEDQIFPQLEEPPPTEPGTRVADLVRGRVRPD